MCLPIYVLTPYNLHPDTTLTYDSSPLFTITYTSLSLYTYPISLLDAVVVVSKTNLPSMEVDVEIDEMCVGHAAGKQVSLAKGGLRVRSRVALNDGAALLVKYVYIHEFPAPHTPLYHHFTHKSPTHSQITHSSHTNLFTHCSDRYNTSITATCNGSLKLVKRDRSVIEASDSGEVNFRPRSAFDAAAQKVFEEECADAYVNF